MKLKFVTTIFLVISGIIVNGASEKQTFDRAGFYAALASQSLDSVNAGLEAVSKSSISTKEAFEGSLLMKKAGLVQNVRSKYNLFKSGHKKLDDVIARDSKNAELRFLRLMIQENSPRILNYRDEIGEDNKIIQSAYKSLPPAVQKAVVDYSKKSKVLKPAFL